MTRATTFEATLGGLEGTLPLVELPFDVRARFGVARPKVKVTVNGVVLRTTVSVYGGKSYVGFRKEIQTAAGIAVGDKIRVKIEPDQDVREVEVPEDLAQALAKDRAAGKAYEAMSFTHRKEYALWVAGAKKQETRERRIAKTLEMVKAARKK